MSDPLNHKHVIRATTMPEAELKRIIEEAAEAGAKKALTEIGLHDEHAGTDVRELRSLLELWRDTKKTAFQTITRTITTAFLAALAAGVWYSYWPKGK